MDKVSVVIPVYNMGSYLFECIKSIVNQTYSNVEIILVDDGSTDDSYKVCCECKEKYSTVKVYRQNNMGSGAARNLGISHASGKYIHFADADDYLENDAIERLVNIAEKENSDLVVFGYRKIYDNGKIVEKKYGNRKCTGDEVRLNYEEYFSETYTWGIQGAPWNKLFLLDTIKKYNIEYPNLKRHQDEVFISRYVAKAERIVFVTDVLYNHYLNSKKLIYKKFPLTYISIVKELYFYRKEVIGKWNVQNNMVKGLMYSEYINNTVKACCLVYNPDLKYKKKDRISWYKTNLKDFEFERVHQPIKYIGLTKYLQNLIFSVAVKHEWYIIVDFCINLRARK